MVLQSYCLTVLLSYCLTVLPSYCLTVLQSHCLTVLPSYCLTVLQSYCLILYYSLTVLLYYSLTVLHCTTVLLSYCTKCPIVLQYFISVIEKSPVYTYTHNISKHCIDISYTETKYHDIVWIPGACATSCNNSLWLVRESWAIASYYYCTTKLCELLVQWLLVLNRR